MPAVWIVPALDEPEDGGARVGVRVKGAPIDQFAPKRGEEDFAERIVETIPNCARRANAQRLAAMAERERRVLAFVVGMMDHAGRPPLRSRHLESGEHELRSEVGRHSQPTTRRLKADSTTARNRNPAQGGTEVMSATQSSLGAEAVKSRFTRSGTVGSRPGRALSYAGGSRRPVRRYA